MGIDVAQLRKVAFSGEGSDQIPVTRRMLRQVVEELEAARANGEKIDLPFEQIFGGRRT